MIVKALRNGVGMVVVFISWLTLPRPIKRSEAAQADAQARAQGLALYQLYACPFCVKTRRAIHRLNITIEVRDIKHPQHREALATQGGRVMVPCLRIMNGQGDRWLYESGDIIQYLNEQFG